MPITKPQKQRSLNSRQVRVQQIVAALKNEYPDAQCALEYQDPFQLMIATILSAQCTDVRVNKVTPELFKKYSSVRSFANAPQAELEEMIRTTGFFRNKSKNIIGASQRIMNQYGGQVPRDMESLLTLPGVARKTANVVLGTAFGTASGVVVDTHVFRITHRLGLTKGKTPEKVEMDLISSIPPDEWINFSHCLIHHGRKVCMARKPACERCVLKEVCPKIGIGKTKG